MTYIRIFFPINEEKPRISTDLKQDKVAEIIGEYLRTQLGKGKDESQPTIRNEYEITLELDLTDDSFKLQHDTGNMSLVTGILMEVAQKTRSREVEFLE